MHDTDAGLAAGAEEQAAAPQAGAAGGMEVIDLAGDDDDDGSNPGAWQQEVDADWDEAADADWEVGEGMDEDVDDMDDGGPGAGPWGDHLYDDTSDTDDSFESVPGEDTSDTSSDSETSDEEVGPGFMGLHGPPFHDHHAAPHGGFNPDAAPPPEVAVPLQLRVAGRGAITTHPTAGGPGGSTFNHLAALKERGEVVGEGEDRPQLAALKVFVGADVVQRLQATYITRGKQQQEGAPGACGAPGDAASAGGGGSDVTSAGQGVGIAAAGAGSAGITFTSGDSRQGSISMTLLQLIPGVSVAPSEQQQAQPQGLQHEQPMLLNSILAQAVQAEALAAANQGLVAAVGAAPAAHAAVQHLQPPLPSAAAPAGRAARMSARPTSNKDGLPAPRRWLLRLAGSISTSNIPHGCLSAVVATCGKPDGTLDPTAAVRSVARYGRKHQHFRLQAAPGFAITALHGRQGWYVDALGAVFTAAVPSAWSPAAHPTFPCEFRDAVRTLLLLRARGGAFGALPLEVVLAVVQALNRLCYHEFEAVEDAGFWGKGRGFVADLFSTEANYALVR